MKASEAIKKIQELLGLEFSAVKESFATTFLTDETTQITNNLEKETFEVGDTLYIVGETTLSPAPSGSHETREGLILDVNEESVITAIRVKEAEVEEEVTEELTTAKLTDGTEIMTEEEGDKFEVGQVLYAKTESGEIVKAPEGEHTTESGIVITVDGEGVITGVKYPDEAGEGSLEDLKKEMDNMKKAMSEMLSLFSSIESFNKELTKLKTDFTKFKIEGERKPVETKKDIKQSFADYRLDILKSIKK